MMKHRRRVLEHTCTGLLTKTCFSRQASSRRSKDSSSTLGLPCGCTQHTHCSAAAASRSRSSKHKALTHRGQDVEAGLRGHKAHEHQVRVARQNGVLVPRAHRRPGVEQPVQDLHLALALLTVSGMSCLQHACQLASSARTGTQAPESSTPWKLDPGSGATGKAAASRCTRASSRLSSVSVPAQSACQVAADLAASAEQQASPGVIAIELAPVSIASARRKRLSFACRLALHIMYCE